MGGSGESLVIAGHLPQNVPFHMYGQTVSVACFVGLWFAKRPKRNTQPKAAGRQETHMQTAPFHVKQEGCHERLRLLPLNGDIPVGHDDPLDQTQECEPIMRGHSRISARADVQGRAWRCRAKTETSDACR